MLGTCAVVWRSHREVLSSGGYSFLKFARSCMRGLAAVTVTSRLPLIDATEDVEGHPAREGYSGESPLRDSKSMINA